MNETVLGHQVGAAAILVWAMQKIKGRYPQFNGNMARWVSIAYAAVVALGIQVVIHGNFEYGWTGQFVIPPVTQMFDVVVHFSAQYAISHGLYKIST